MQLKKIGIVISKKMQKTIVVKIVHSFMHKKYGKIISKSKQLLVHDKYQIAKVGNIVHIKQTKPISKNKFWLLNDILDLENNKVITK